MHGFGCTQKEIMYLLRTPPPPAQTRAKFSWRRAKLILGQGEFYFVFFISFMFLRPVGVMLPFFWYPLWIYKYYATFEIWDSLMGSMVTGVFLNSRFVLHSWLVLSENLFSWNILLPRCQEHAQQPERQIWQSTSDRFVVKMMTSSHDNFFSTLFSFQ